MASLAHIPLFRSFQYREFRFLWVAAFLWSAGNWMQRLAVSWLVLRSTGSPVAVALVYALNFGPNLFLGPIIGTLLDRVNRKRLLMVIQSMACAVSIALTVLVLTTTPKPWTVLLLMACFGLFSSFNFPTIATMAYDVVGPRDVLNATALRSIGQRVMSIAGAVTGGALIAALGPGSAILGACIMFGLAVLVTSMLRYRQPAATATRAGVGAQLREGFRYFGSSGGILSLLGVAMAAEAFGFGAISLLPFFADEVLDVGPQGLGFLSGAVGLGGTVGGLALASFGRTGHRGLVLATAFLCYGVFIGGLSQSGVFPLSILTLIGFGLASGIFDSSQVVLLQSNVPDQMRGRVMGAWSLALGMGPVGALALGFMAEGIGVQNAVGIGAALMLAIAFTVGFALPYLRRLQ